MVAGLALATTLAGCSSPTTSSSPPPSASSASASPSASTATASESPTPATTSPTTAVPAAADWTTYHHDPARTGVTTGVAPFGSAGALRRAWTAQLDGAVYGEPLVIASRVVVATENDSLYALDAGTGAVLWRQHVGTPAALAQLPCGDIDPLGVTSTPVYDPATGRVFALAETSGGGHVFVGVDVTTGRVAVRVPVTLPRGTQSAYQQRAALALVDGRVYIPFGGLYGDCGSYVGTVVSLTTAGASPQYYTVPTSREGGIWATGGVVVAGGRLLVSVGNGASTNGYDGSDSVVALSPGLSRLDLFAPSGWASDNLHDKDLGSLTPAIVGGFVYADGKSGTAYTMRLEHLGGIGGQVAASSVCRAFGTTAVAGATVYVPCTDGTRAVRVSPTGSMGVVWHAPVAARGSPVVGGGVVWVVDYSAGQTYVLDLATGAVRASIDVGTAPHFASLSLSGSRAFVGTLTGVVAVSGA
jgi:polyvinyl alcohol dehydrogenase (cytochrome)